MLASDTHKHILIVDRDLAGVEDIRQRLSEAGFVVRAIGHGPAVVAAVAQHPPHLVIIDWQMPGFAALEIIADVRNLRLPHPVRLIVLSTLSSEPDVVAGLTLGADDYIAKPFSVREVVARVFAVLRTRVHAVHHAVNVQRLRKILSTFGLEERVALAIGL